MSIRHILVGCLLTAAASAQPSTSLEALERRFLDAEARGREPEMLEISLDVLETIARDSAAFTPLRKAAFEVHLGRIEQVATGLARHGEVIERLEALPRPHLDGWMDARRLYAIQRLAHFGNDLERAARATAALGFVQDFWVLGPLDNERGSGYARSTQAEESFDRSLTLRGKEREVTWRPLPRRDPSRGLVALDAIFRPNEQCLAYAIAFVESEETRDVALTIGTDEAYRLQWNGREVLARDVRRSYSFEQDRVVVRLRAGRNALQLKSCQQEGRWRFSVRLTDLQGDALSDVRILGEAPAEMAWGETEPTLENLTPDALDEARGVAEGSDPLANLYFGALSFERGAHDVSEHPEREPLARALEGLEHAGIAYRHAVSFAQRGRRIAAELDVNPFRQALERTLALDPGHVPTLTRLFQLYATALAIPSKADALIDRIEKAAEGGVIAALTSAAWLDQRNRGAEAIVRLDSAEFANDWRVQQRRALLLDRLGRHPEALEAARRVLERVPAQEDALGIVIGHHLRRGELEAAHALAARHVADEPWALERSLELLRILRLQGEDEAARALLLGLHATCPENPRLLEELSTLEFALDRREEGLAHLRRAVELDPKNTALERYLRFHEKQREPFYAPYRIALEEVLERAQEHGSVLESARARNLPVAHLWKRHVVKLNADYTTSRYVHLVTRILGEEGVARYDTFRAERGGDATVRFLEARVIGEGGRTARAALGSSRRAAMLSRLGLIDLPPLQVGDLVEIEYTVDDLRRTWFGDYHGDDHVLSQDGETTLVSELTLIHPPDVPLKTHLRNLEPSALRVTTSTSEDATLMQFVTGPLEAPVIEPGMPAGREILPHLEYTTYESWEAFTRWWWNLVSNQQRVSEAMRARVRELVEGADTDLEKIRRIYEFVANEIDYEAWEFGVHGYKPYDAPTIYSRRHGDCKDKAILINAMLSEVGIRSYPVLIRAEETRSAEDLTLARIGQFNHCISFVPGDLERPDLFLDGTAEGHPVDVVPGMDRGAHVIVVQEGEPVMRIVPRGEPSENALRLEFQAELDAQLGASVRMLWEARGLQAAELRRAFRGEELLRRKKLTDLLTSRFGETEVLSMEFSDLDDLTVPLRIVVEARVKRLVSGEGARGTLPHVWIETGLNDLCSSTQRVHDIVLDSPRQWETRFTYRLQEGMRIAGAPRERTFLAPALDYVVEVASAGERELTLTRRLVQHGSRIEASDYDALRQAVLEIRESEVAPLEVEIVR